jgi:hypothetical protein
MEQGDVMTRNALRVCVALAALLTLTVVAPTGIVYAANGYHWGPYPFSGNPTDIGTCGGWATDTFQRSFDVQRNPDGTYAVQTHDDGTFVTLAGQSPDACDPKTGDGGAGRVAAGITGRTTGTTDYSSVVAPSFNPHGCDDGACSTCADWLAKVLGSDSRSVGTHTFNGDYVADPGQALTARNWHNASPELGGNHGDIRSTP